MRTIETTANPDGSSTSHVVVHCTLADLARATGLRVEDAAFALNECGLLIRRAKPKSSQPLIGSSNSSSFFHASSHAAAAADEPSRGRAVEETIVVSREMVEAVAKERNVKKMCMDLAHVML
ncbi:hypothetical protein NLI96_g2174 [Meripilus lineatus]|uniref:Uncharacterized protein n=1 Tax=Meripilus lineatus TaxID=2056292 RepID=A0AAD5VAQ7_9APHY|nr:hypothetical protein NLI96_g2174 [Physisporinus lineatus]